MKYKFALLCGILVALAWLFGQPSLLGGGIIAGFAALDCIVNPEED
jgi:hypothetical protein